MSEDLLPVCESSRRPSLEEMTTAGQCSRFDHDPILPAASAHEQYQPCPFSNTGNNAARPPEMSCSHIEGDDVDTLAYTEDVARVPRVPERGRVA